MGCLNLSEGSSALMWFWGVYSKSGISENTLNVHQSHLLNKMNQIVSLGLDEMGMNKTYGNL